MLAHGTQRCALRKLHDIQRGASRKRIRTDIAHLTGNGDILKGGPILEQLSSNADRALFKDKRIRKHDRSVFIVDIAIPDRPIVRIDDLPFRRIVPDRRSVEHEGAEHGDPRAEVHGGKRGTVIECAGIDRHHAVGKRNALQSAAIRKRIGADDLKRRRKIDLPERRTAVERILIDAIEPRAVDLFQKDDIRQRRAAGKYILTEHGKSDADRRFRQTATAAERIFSDTRYAVREW